MKKILENFDTLRVFFDSRVEWYKVVGGEKVLHRTDGPALITTQGEWFYYLDGKECSFETWYSRVRVD